MEIDDNAGGFGFADPLQNGVHYIRQFHLRRMKGGVLLQGGLGTQLRGINFKDLYARDIKLCEAAVFSSSDCDSANVTYRARSPATIPARRNCRPNVVLPEPGSPQSGKGGRREDRREECHQDREFRFSGGFRVTGCGQGSSEDVRCSFLAGNHTNVAKNQGLTTFQISRLHCRHGSWKKARRAVPRWRRSGAISVRSDHLQLRRHSYRRRGNARAPEKMERPPFWRRIAGKAALVRR